MFRELIFPLRDRRTITLDMDYAEETAVEYREQLLAYLAIDIVLVEGIFLHLPCILSRGGRVQWPRTGLTSL
jgi:hypothetical protein